VLGSHDQPPIVVDRLTVPALLRRHGCHTACFGKWHLGLTWPRVGKERRSDLPFRDGPLDAGFDEYFGISIPNWGPFRFLKNDRCVGTPAERIPEMPSPPESRNERLAVPSIADRYRGVKSAAPTTSSASTPGPTRTGRRARPVRGCRQALRSAPSPAGMARAGGSRACRSA